MWEYKVVVKDDIFSSFFIWGNSFKDACERNHLNPDEMVVLFYDYVD